MKNLTNPTAAARADRDAVAISTLLGIDTGTTFFPHGTELNGLGAKLARRDRTEFLRLPALEEGMDRLRAAVQAEERADHWVDLGGISVDYLGRVVCERDERTPDCIIPRLVPSEGGWQRLAAFAPEDVPAGLRTNVNAWAAVRAWALANGDNPALRIALCGWEGEHTMPPRWTCITWRPQNAYQNAHRERIWFSPHCLLLDRQADLFTEAS